MNERDYHEIRNDCHDWPDHILARNLVYVEREMNDARARNDYPRWSGLVDTAQVYRDEIAYRANPPQNDEID